MEGQPRRRLGSLTMRIPAFCNLKGGVNAGVRRPANGRSRPMCFAVPADVNYSAGAQRDNPQPPVQR